MTDKVFSRLIMRPEEVLLRLDQSDNGLSKGSVRHINSPSGEGVVHTHLKHEEKGKPITQSDLDVIGMEDRSR